MTLDRFIHKLRCFFSKKYKEQRRDATIDLINRLTDSRSQVLKKIEDSITVLERNYAAACKQRAIGSKSHWLDEMEAEIVKRRFILQELKAGNRLRDIDKSALNDIMKLLET